MIVTWRAPERALRAARALRASRRPLDGLVLVDNGGGAADALRAALPAATVVSTPGNLGFAGGANAGIAAALEAGAEAVLLVNDDAALEPDALARLEQAMVPGVGIAGPALLVAGSRDRLESLGLSFSPRTGRLRELGRGAAWGARAPAAPLAVDGVSACVMLVTRPVLQALGGFDPGYFFYFEDLDLCLRARDAGWRTVVVPRALAWHEGSATIGRRSPRRLYHAVRGHLRLGQRRGGSRPRQAAIAAWNLLHALRRARDYDPGALRAVWRGVLDHLAG